MDLKQNGMTLINKETGEIYENIVKVITENQDDFISGKRKMSELNKRFNEENGGFIFKEDSAKVDKLESKLTDSDIIKILYLATYLDYDSYIKTDEGKFMTKSDIQNIIGVNKNLFGVWYNKIVKLNIISKDNIGFMMSKGYYIKGSINKNKDYNRMFIKGARQVYQDNKNSNQTIVGSMIRLLPYVNAHTNVLCWNPLESDEDKIIPITMAELCAHLGYANGHERSLMRKISKIRVFDSHPLVVFFNDNENYSESYLMFHPDICYSGKNEMKNEIRKMFVMFSHKYEHKNLVDNVKERKLLRRN